MTNRANSYAALSTTNELSLVVNGEEAVMDEKLRRDRETQEEVAEFFGIDL